MLAFVVGLENLGKDSDLVFIERGEKVENGELLLFVEG